MTTTTAAIRTRVIDVVVRLAPEPCGSTVDEQTDLVDGLGYHSVALVELGFEIEETFHLPPISADDVEHVRTVGDLVQFVLVATGT